MRVFRNKRVSDESGMNTEEKEGLTAVRAYIDSVCNSVTEQQHRAIAFETDPAIDSLFDLLVIVTTKEVALLRELCNTGGVPE